MHNFPVITIVTARKLQLNKVPKFKLLREFLRGVTWWVTEKYAIRTSLKTNTLQEQTKRRP